MSSHVAWAGADRLVVLDLTDGTDTTGIDARIDALQFEASLVGGTIFMGCALGVAPAMRVTLEELGAGTLDLVVNYVTVSSVAASIICARIHAAVLTTVLITVTV